MTGFLVLIHILNHEFACTIRYNHYSQVSVPFSLLTYLKY